VNYSHRSPKGNRHMRRLLSQTANVAVKVKGSIFEIIDRVASRASDIIQPSESLRIDKCRLMWLILHQGTRYEERGGPFFLSVSAYPSNGLPVSTRHQYCRQYHPDAALEVGHKILLLERPKNPTLPHSASS